jgi:hydroxymethylglutaryl-CoA synthase
VVVGADIAVYETAAARPTGGAGAVAVAVGPNAPLRLEAGLRASHMVHAYDFFKPRLAVEYPTVDGHVSNRFFLQALDACFAGYAARWAATRGGAPFRLDTDVDYVIFHTPYAKLAQRATARLVSVCAHVHACRRS